MTAMRRCSALALPLLVPLATGCIRHEATVTPVAPPASARTGGVAIAGTVRTWPQEPMQRAGALPQTIAADGWLGGDDGLAMARARVATPLQWWQRFPCDAVTDLWPGTITVAATRPLASEPVRPVDPAALRAEAAAAGYIAGPTAGPTGPNSGTTR
jgi:hypothetical protein